MDTHAYTVLEFYTLLDTIGAQTQTSRGRQAIAGFRPATRLNDLAERAALYAEVMALLAVDVPLPGLQFDDLDEILRSVLPEGAVLDGVELVACRALMDTALGAAVFLRREECATSVRLQALAARVQPCDALRNRLYHCLDNDGTVLDSASDLLRTLRRRVTQVGLRLQKTLERMVQDQQFASVVQESFVTTRNDRFVIPVRREAKASIPGIIHDHSNSGATVFVEPTETLPMGNELADLRLQVRDEIRRILAELSSQVRAATPVLRVTQDALVELDAAFAVGRWGSSYRCVSAQAGNALKLIQARHPLLERQLRQEGRQGDLVPLEFTPPGGIQAVVVTGSNTGGKTVTLKTIGLLVLMAQTGLPVPVDPSSRFPWFDHVYADIGDEQSLTASLSTFSAHMGHVTAIFAGVRRGRSLVLLDELGAGTDPLEGGALACAILQELAGHATLTVATTHLGVVKQFVHECPRMMNAAVRFNTQSLRPEYILDVGRPGASHALLIAERLNLPAEVLTAARSMLSGDQLQLEQVLARMEEDQRRLANAERDARGAHEAIIRDRDSLKNELEELRKERRKLMHEAYQQAAGIVENARREMELQIKRLRETKAETENAAAAEEARKAIEERDRRLSRGIQQTAPKPDNPVEPASLRLGDRVWVEKLRAYARVTHLTENRKRVTVEVDGLPFVVSSRGLGRAPKETASAASVVKVSRPRAQGATPAEINLVGFRVDEAITGLQHFLNQAMLANLEEIRIVHGFGTGRLRDGIHDWLARQSLIRNVRLGGERDPGGAGVTHVQL